MSLLNKIKFLLTKPKVVIVLGGAKETAKEAISQVLKPHFKVGKEILIIDQDSKFFIKHSRLPILVVTHVGEYHPDKEFFAGDIAQVAEIVKLAETLPSPAYLILNFDDETVREIKNKSRAHPLTFGFGVRADIRVSDVVLAESPTLETNFKINYKGNVVPVWLKGKEKEEIYAALAAAAVGEVLGLNLVEISEALKKSSNMI